MHLQQITHTAGANACGSRKKSAPLIWYHAGAATVISIRTAGRECVVHLYLTNLLLL